VPKVETNLSRHTHIRQNFGHHGLSDSINPQAGADFGGIAKGCTQLDKLFIDRLSFRTALQHDGQGSGTWHRKGHEPRDGGDE